jgi:hypothetical protein
MKTDRAVLLLKSIWTEKFNLLSAWKNKFNVLTEAQSKAISYHMQIFDMMLGGSKHHSQRFWFHNMFQET